MPRKGTAIIKKVDKYDELLSDSDDGDVSGITDGSAESADANKSHSVAKELDLTISDIENIDPAVAREQPKPSNEARLAPGHRAGQPRQASGTVEQSATLAISLFPDNDGLITTNIRSPLSHISAHTYLQEDCPILESPSRVPSSFTPSYYPKDASQGKATSAVDLTLRPADHDISAKEAAQQHPPRPNLQCNASGPKTRDPDTMVQGGAFIPTNQQRNMRACMVCSIVRTQHQFMTQGCPNCEEILELANNSEQINDCTSQVFEGLISVADTNRSWVARYQRLEGYVPGVYATQVEGILPEDVLVAVENAGINYVPRDGSEQEMLGKD
jgi:transcription elongation factor SPT4